MTCADNNRISHRQLYRQICMVFLAPFLLCLFGRDRLMGGTGLAGLALAVALICFSVIFLVRLAPHYGELRKTRRTVLRVSISVLFLGYILTTAAYLLSVLADIVPLSMLEGVSGRWIVFFSVLVCSLGTEKGMQRMGRLAEVSAGILLGSVILMMMLALGQARIEYVADPAMWRGSAADLIKSVYLYLCAFSGIGLLPFLLGEVEKTAGSGKPILRAVLTVSSVMAGMLLLLPAVFGVRRLMTEKYPILPLLSVTNLPGNVLARFDVLWMGAVLYGIFFSLGSLFHYGNQMLFLLRQVHTREYQNTGRIIGQWQPPFLALLAWGLCFQKFGDYGIQDYYVYFLAYVFLPLLVLLQSYLLLRPSKSRKAARAAAVLGVLSSLFLLGGCSGIDPEKRLYPLALGVDKKELFLVSYGIPALPQATGQNEPQDQNESTCLTLAGINFAGIGEKYHRTQEKYLDLGHLQVLLLGPGILENRDWDLVLDYLKGEAEVGEDVYVFFTEDPARILEWQSESGTSAGEYLTGILENRMGGKKNPSISLREVYQQFYQDGSLPDLPEVRLENEMLEIV